jgi:hypothetical protein
VGIHVGRQSVLFLVNDETGNGDAEIRAGMPIASERAAYLDLRVLSVRGGGRVEIEAASLIVCVLYT